MKPRNTLLAGVTVLALAATVAASGSPDPEVLDGKARAGLASLEFAAPDSVAVDALASTTVTSDADLTSDALLPCVAGFAGIYPCSNVELLSIVPLAELGGAAGNDSWGWTDPTTGDEYAIMGTGTGTSFVRITDPTLPEVLGRVSQAGGPTTGASGAVWRDIKVDNDHAFIVSERGGGMQVVDLRQLRGLTANPGRELQVTALYTGSGFGSAHNIVINEETDRAYLVGGNFRGGLHIVDIANPAAPAFLGSFEADGYTHDAQCVLYHGPDTDFYEEDEAGNVLHQSELCFAANEDSITIVDVTDPASPVMLNKIKYTSSKYTHQGWLTPDHKTFVFNDEVDEGPTAPSVTNTTTYIVNVEEIDDRTYSDADVVRYLHPTRSVDHNLYIVDDLIYEANYNAGLRVLRYTDETLKTGALEEVAFFDVDPGLDVQTYGGAWNVYPFFESGTIVVSTMDEGLFLLKLSPGLPQQEDPDA